MIECHACRDFGKYERHEDHAPGLSPVPFSTTQKGRMMNDRQMTAAEMRARTTALGLSLNQLSEIGSMDLRGVRRQAGGTTPVTPKTARAIENLESRAKSVRESFLSAGEIELPSWGESVPGDPDLPSSFYHAAAGSVADRVTIRYAFE